MMCMRKIPTYKKKLTKIERVQKRAKLDYFQGYVTEGQLIEIYKVMSIRESGKVSTE